MKFALLLATTILSSAGLPAHAAASEIGAMEAICSDGVTAHPRKKNFWHLDYPRFARGADALYGTMNLPANERGSYAVVKTPVLGDVAFNELARFADSPRGLALHDGKLYVLFRDSYLALDANTGAVLEEVKTSDTPVNAEEESAHGFAWSNGQLVIAHGTQGIVVHDGAGKVVSTDELGLKTERQQSKASAVTEIGEGKLVIAVENVTVSNVAPFPFEGLISYDLQAKSATRHAYTRKGAGSLALPRLAASGDTLYVNNWGILHTFSLAALKDQKELKPTWVPVKFEVEGKMEPGELLGDILANEEGILACGHVSYKDPASPRILHRGLVYSKAK